MTQLCQPEFTDEQRHVVWYLTVASSGLSIFGSSFILVNYFILSKGISPPLLLQPSVLLCIIPWCHQCRQESFNTTGGVAVHWGLLVGGVQSGMPYHYSGSARFLHMGGMCYIQGPLPILCGDGRLAVALFLQRSVSSNAFLCITWQTIFWTCCIAFFLWRSICFGAIGKGRQTDRERERENSIVMCCCGRVLSNSSTTTTLTLQYQLFQRFHQGSGGAST